MKMEKFENKVENSVFNILQNLKYDASQNMITNGPPPSLFYVACNKIAITLWIGTIKKSGIENLKLTDLIKKMKSFKTEILSAVNEMDIPVFCKLDLSPIIDQICSELINFFKFELNFCQTSILRRLNMYLDIIVWTQEGTINIVKTVLQVIKQRKSRRTVSDDIHIFELACNNFLEEGVLHLLNQSPMKDMEFISNYNIDERYHMVAYWVFLANETSEFSKITNGVATTEYLLKWAISNRKVTAVKYVWEKLADEATKSQLAEYIDFTVDNSCQCCENNILFYFCQQLNQLQFDQLSLLTHSCLLRKVFKISRWSDIVSVSRYVVELFSLKHHFDMFEIILFCLRQDYLNLREFKSVWSELFLQFEHDLDENIVPIYNRFSDFHLCVEKQMIIVSLFLQTSTCHNMKMLLNEQNMIKMFGQWIRLGKSDGFVGLINNVLQEGSELSAYKSKFFKSQSFDICRHLIVEAKYETVNEFLFDFCTEDKSKFKYEMAYENDFEIINCIMTNSPDYLSDLDKFLSWSFEGNIKQIEKFKSDVFALDSIRNNVIGLKYFSNIGVLIKEKKYKSITKYWQWIFLATEDRILTQRDKFLRILKIIDLTCENRLTLSFRKCYNLLKKFIALCCSRSEIEKLVGELQFNNKPLLNLVKYVLCIFELEEAYFGFYTNKPKHSFEIAQIRVKFASSILYVLTEKHINKSSCGWFKPYAESKAAFKECMASFYASLTVPKTSQSSYWPWLEGRVTKLCKDLSRYSKDKIDSKHKRRSIKRKIGNQEGGRPSKMICKERRNIANIEQLLDHV